MSIFVLAFLGGLSSFASTSFGALLTLFSKKGSSPSNRWSLSIDFALGIMISASAFTLIGPAALEALQSAPTSLSPHYFSVLKVLLVAALGALFIYFLKFQIQKLSSVSKKYKTSHILLASVLMLHNFPEGVASGSALAGLDLKSALTIMGGIAIQNVPEGFLMVICLMGLGWSYRSSLLGGIGSGVVELLGALLAGVLIHSVDGILPLILSFAGGCMIASVFIELAERKEGFWQVVFSKEFALGLLCLPAIQFLLT